MEDYYEVKLLESIEGDQRWEITHSRYGTRLEHVNIPLYLMGVTFLEGGILHVENLNAHSPIVNDHYSKLERKGDKWQVGELDTIDVSDFYIEDVITSGPSLYIGNPTYAIDIKNKKIL